MIDDLDEALRELLVRELPIKDNEIDIAFDQPRQQWSSRLSRPTLNLFLHDMRENAKLRREQTQWEVERDNGKIVQRRKPFRVDLHYLVTAWASAPEDEHRLLSRALLALLRYPELPADVLPEGLQDQPMAIPLRVAQYENLEKMSDFWSVMDNQQRPAITCIVTLSFEPHRLITTPLTRTAEVKFGEATGPADLHSYVSLRGTVRSKTPLQNLRVTLVERGVEAEVRPSGEYAIRHLQPGDYTLEIAAEGRKPSRHKIKVPSPNYDLDV